MKGLNQLISDDTESWINGLPKYQENRINQILSSGKSVNEAADIWLSISPPNIVPFGTTKGQNIFLDKIKQELEGLLCGNSKYDDYRQKLSDETKLTKQYAIGLISAAIAPVVGSSGPFIAPVIALLLMGMGKVSINAWCSCCEEKRTSIDKVQV